MGMFPQPERTYEDGRTKQSFTDVCDINKIIARAARAGTLSHLEKHGGQYGDFSDFDFFEAQNMLARAKSTFEELPAEIRREFDHDPAQFFEFVNSPDKQKELPDLLAKLCRPGNQLPDVTGKTGVEQPRAAADNNNPGHSPPKSAQNEPQGASSPPKTPE